MSPSPANMDRKNPEKIIKGIPIHMTCKYSHAKIFIFPFAPKKARISSPNNRPTVHKTMLIIMAMSNACSALLSASFLLS